MLEHEEYYSTLLNDMQSHLTQHGYRRSGQSGLFYRYDPDRSVACAIELQRSAFNYPGCYSFTFNLVCIHLFNLAAPRPNKLSLPVIRAALRSPLAERLGVLTRRGDYWWSITDELSAVCPPAEYYQRFLHHDIEQGLCWLDSKAAKSIPKQTL